jgi:hypothetical protein
VRELIAVSFALYAVLIVLVMIAQWRFYGAYLDRYGGVEGRRRLWQPWRWNPSRPPWTLASWFRPLDDPLVERRRRQHLLAWGGIALFFAIPIALILYSVVVHR